MGIRLDSGDLAWLSIEARKMLDAAGFENVKIAASNDLDEHIIASLRQQGARIDIWGVGTRLITAFDQPALGGVYKLTALRQPGGAWDHKIKLSEQAIKISNPGILQVRRFFVGGEAAGDMILTEDIDTFTSALQTAPRVLTEGIVIISSFAYLAWLSLPLFGMLSVTLIVCLVAFNLAQRYPFSQMRLIRAKMDSLYKNVRDLVEGSRELQLNKARGHMFVDQVIAKDARDFAIRAGNLY